MAAGFRSKIFIRVRATTESRPKDPIEIVMFIIIIIIIIPRLLLFFSYLIQLFVCEMNLFSGS